MELLFNSLKELCRDLEKTYWIAYSGGLDSHVLLHSLSQLRNAYPLKLYAVYINHGISKYANAWGFHCERVCRGLQIDFLQRKISIPLYPGQSIEEAARAHRYAVFSELLHANDFLLTAHHEDDQAETVFLQFLRGAGPKGMAAMPLIKPLGKGFHARPFLNVRQFQLKTYAESEKLRWIEDDSNDHRHLTRNYLRHEVLPLLKKRWPTVSKTMARVAKHCADADDLLSGIGRDDLAKVMDPVTKRLSLKKLLELNPSRQILVLRIWLQHLQFPLPSHVKMQQILQNFLKAGSDKVPLIRFANVELRRYRDEIYAMKALLPHDPKIKYTWDLQSPLSIPNLGVITVDKKIGSGIREMQNITIRFRKGGEVCKLQGRTCHHDLKKLFQQWGVPPWQRARIPLIYVEEELVSIVGFYVDERFVAKENAYGNVFVFNEI